MPLVIQLHSDRRCVDNHTPANARLSQCRSTRLTQDGRLIGAGLRLILTLFAPGSHMDQVYKSIQLLNADMCARVARNAAVAGSNVGGYQDCSQPLDNDDFYDFLDQIIHAPQPALCRGGSDRCQCTANPGGNQTICNGSVADGSISGSSGVTS